MHTVVDEIENVELFSSHALPEHLSMRLWSASPQAQSFSAAALVLKGYLLSVRLESKTELDSSYAIPSRSMVVQEIEDAELYCSCEIRSSSRSLGELTQSRCHVDTTVGNCLRTELCESTAVWLRKTQSFTAAVPFRYILCCPLDREAELCSSCVIEEVVEKAVVEERALQQLW